MRDEEDHITSKGAERPGPGREARSFRVDGKTARVAGTGATADHIQDQADPDEDQRLDEGLEETFPASDPVSAKHIS